MAKQIKLVSAFFTVGFWTLLSRIMGFVRDILISQNFGSGPVAEAFLIAFSLPNMFRRFFAEGAFNMAFVPMFSKKYEDGDDALEFARDATSGLATILLIFTLLAQIAMPFLVWMMASGFAGDERFDLAVSFGRITFPYILFISLAALFSGLLNSLGRFAAAAAAPVFLNIILVAMMVLANMMGWNVGNTLAWGVPIAGVAQMMLVWVSAKRAGFKLTLKFPRLTPDLKRLAIIAGPAVLAGGVVQINLLVGRQVASQFNGAIQWLNIADRIYQLPLGVVGIAIGVVLLPKLSRSLRAEDVADSSASLNSAAEFSLLLTIPASVALLVIPLPLVSVLFERGAFLASDSLASANALAIYAIGLPAFVLQKVFQPVFFSRGDTKTPFYYAIWAMVINVILAVGLAFYIGYLAAAVATTVAGWIMLLQLWWGSRQFGDYTKLKANFGMRVIKIIAASLGMGAVIFAASLYLSDVLQMQYWRYLALLFVVLLGMVSYGVFAVLLGAVNIQELKSTVRRKG